MDPCDVLIKESVRPMFLSKRPPYVTGVLLIITPPLKNNSPVSNSDFGGNYNNSPIKFGPPQAENFGDFWDPKMRFLKGKTLKKGSQIWKNPSPERPPFFSADLSQKGGVARFYMS